jgi:hypothetical protein
VIFEPPAAVDQLPTILHVLLDPQGASWAADDVVLLSGSMSSKNLSDLGQGRVSESLAERLIDAARWRDPQGRVVLAPLTRLSEGASYSLAIPAIGWTTSVSTSSHAAHALLPRVWPPDGLAGGASHAVWCERPWTAGRAVSQPRPAVLWPAGVAGVFDDGALAGFGQACISWRADDGGPPAALVPPPVVQRGDGVQAFLEPGWLTAGSTEEVAERPACPPGFVQTEAVCFDVQDDRAIVRVRRSPLLLGFSATAVAGAAVLDAGSAVALRPLPVQSTTVVELVARGLLGSVMQ